MLGLAPVALLPETTHRVSLADEYLNQFKWRDWQRALSLCPIRPGRHVLDMGCGVGDVTAALAARGASVLGIDSNADLVASARERHPDCSFDQQDLNRLDLSSSSFDGIWCSFAAAYFVNFEQTFASWCDLLKPTAWVCLIEIDDLFNHEPLSQSTHRALERFYENAVTHGRYDFRAGSKLRTPLESNGFRVQRVDLADKELAFAGPASPDVIGAWRFRLNRMGSLRSFFGSRYRAFESEFLACLADNDHRSLCTVTCCVGSR
jgi:ubiquinone/menaquinone biosynthesis C-methylase UbiE